MGHMLRIEWKNCTKKGMDVPRSLLVLSKAGICKSHKGTQLHCKYLKVHYRHAIGYSFVFFYTGITQGINGHMHQILKDYCLSKAIMP